MSHYALDITRRMFHKNVIQNSYLPALLYYMFDGHMYPVTCKKTRESILKAAAKEYSPFTRSTLYDKDENAQEKAEELIKEFQKKSFTDVPLDSLIAAMKDKNNIYND